MNSLTPAQAWRTLKAGNDRFVGGRSNHPSQGIDTRERLVEGQNPQVVLFGCSDSRLAAEIIFDQGLGDMFVVRTAGHIIDPAVLGSIEFATDVLNVPLIVVLGHDRCGAIGATMKALDELEIPGGNLRNVVERVTPSVLLGRAEGLTGYEELIERHVIETGKLLVERSRDVAERVERGQLAIVGLTYRLSDGQVRLASVIGDIED